MRFLKESVVRDFNKAAKKYDDYAVLQREVVEHLLALIKSKLLDGDVVVDCGGGTGYLAKLLDCEQIACDVVQCDISYDMCLAAANNVDSLTVCVGDMDDLPIGDASVEHYFSSMTLQWADDVLVPLQHAYRVLKRGGVCAISVVGDGSLFELQKSFAELDDLPHMYDNFVKMKDLQSIFIDVGFVDCEISMRNITLYYNNIYEVLKSIKGVGGGYKLGGKRKYLGRDYFARLEREYFDKFAVDAMLPLSWNIIYVVAKK